MHKLLHCFLDMVQDRLNVTIKLNRNLYLLSKITQSLMTFLWPWVFVQNRLRILYNQLVDVCNFLLIVSKFQLITVWSQYPDFVRLLLCFLRDWQECEIDANEGRFKLRDLLSVPMQRVLKYHLFLKVCCRWFLYIHLLYKGLCVCICLCLHSVSTLFDLEIRD